MKCAFAVNDENNFPDRHFGEADNFVIYACENEKLVFKETLINPLMQKHSKPRLADTAKGKIIISLLKNKGVNILVSKQFGTNIGLVNQHFIPVIIAKNQIKKVKNMLQKHMKWFEDELNNKTRDFMLFRINNGILKSDIRQAVNSL